MTAPKKFKILLIAPTAIDYHGKPIKMRRLHLPGLTLPMLAAVTPPETNIRLIFETVEDIPFDDDWDLVGVTSMGSGIVRAWQISDRFRARGVKTIVGGIAASLGKPEWSLAHCDSIVQGEGEETWPRVVRDAMNGSLQHVYASEINPSLAGLPTPRYDLMNPKALGFWRPVQATRGCPFKCTFCSVASFFCGSYRKRPVPEIIRDVRQAKKYGSRYIAFIDDNIAVDFDYCRELWEALIPEKIIWMSQASLQIAEKPELIQLAHRSGCRLLSFGIESVNENSLKTIHKEWNEPRGYMSAIKTLRKHGIDVSTEMIIGLDGDDESIFERTFQFIMSARISVPRVHIITPVPGTPLFSKLSLEKRIVTSDYSDYTGGKVVYRPLNIDPIILEKGYWNLYRKLYSCRSVLKRLLPNRAGLGPYMLAVIWASNIRYRLHISKHISPGIL